jgi:hypothetical protein
MHEFVRLLIAGSRYRGVDAPRIAYIGEFSPVGAKSKFLQQG